MAARLSALGEPVGRIAGAPGARRGRAAHRCKQVAQRAEHAAPRRVRVRGLLRSGSGSPHAVTARERPAAQHIAPTMLDTCRGMCETLTCLPHLAPHCAGALGSACGCRHQCCLAAQRRHTLLLCARRQHLLSVDFAPACPAGRRAGAGAAGATAPTSRAATHQAEAPLPDSAAGDILALCHIPLPLLSPQLTPWDRCDCQGRSCTPSRPSRRRSPLTLMLTRHRRIRITCNAHLHAQQAVT